MAQAPVRRYYRCYYPWYNRVTGEFLSLSYWIGMPKTVYEGGSLSTPYPLLIMQQGGHAYTTRPLMDVGTHITEGGAVCQIHNWDVPTSPYHTHESIVILPDTSDFPEWIEMNDTEWSSDFYAYINCKGGQFSGLRPLRSLINDMINRTITYWGDALCTVPREDLLTVPTVDTDRIYAVGYSYGGMALCSIARDFRDLLACIAVGAGSVFESAQSDYYSLSTSPYFNNIAKQVIYRRCQKMYGIPTIFYEGELDPFWYRSIIGVEQCYRDIQEETGIPHNSYFCYIAGGGHVTGAQGWTGYTTRRFDKTVRTPQAFVSTTGDNFTTTLDWMYSQRRSSLNLPDDPYPVEIIDNDGTGVVSAANRRYFTWGFGTVETELPDSSGPYTYYIDADHNNANDLNVGIYPHAPIKTKKRAANVGRVDDKFMLKIGEDYQEYDIYKLLREIRNEDPIYRKPLRNGEHVRYKGQEKYQIDTTDDVTFEIAGDVVKISGEVGSFVWDKGGNEEHEFSYEGETIYREIAGKDYKITYDGEGSHLFSITYLGQSNPTGVISKDNFIIVYIIGSSDSLEFAEYYAEKHNMDTFNSDPSSGGNSGTVGGIYWEVNGQMVGIESGSTSEILPSQASFDTNILNPLKEALDSSELSNRDVWGIVLGYQVPGGYPYIDEYTGEHIISATSRLSRIYHDFEPQIPNRLYNRQVFKRYDQDDADFALICSRIDAPTLLQAKEFVDNAEELRRQLFVGGTFYIDPYSDQIGDEADAYTASLEEFRDYVIPKLNLDSFSTQFLDPYIDVTIPYVQDDSFVWSWHSGQSDDDFFQFTSYPRAFFYNADYNGGYTIRDENSKTWPILSMRAGYSACAAALSNPTISGFLNPTAFYNALFRLSTIGEAYMYSLPALDWTMTLFGDPLVSIGFPQAVLEDTESLDEDQLWNIVSKDTARIAANFIKKEDDLYDIVETTANSNIDDVEISLLNPAHTLYTSYDLQNRKSLMSSSVSSLFNYPIRVYTSVFGVSIKTLDDYLSLKGYKVSELLLDIVDVEVSDENIFEEGWWEFEHEIQDDYFGFLYYHFILEIYDSENPSGSPIFTSDSFSIDGWSYELSLQNYTAMPVGGVPSSYIGRKVRYQSRKDSLISLDEYLTRGETYYFRIRQYDAVEGTLFPWSNYSDIVWT